MPISRWETVSKMIEELSKIEKELEGNEYFENGLGWYMTFDVPDTIAPLTEIDNGMEYISACSSEETIAFYRAMGAEVTDTPIKSIADAEPYDLQMVRPV